MSSRDEARRRAEQALRYDHDHANSPEVRRRLRGAVEALLAAEPEGKTEPKHTPENCTEGHGGALCDRCFSNVVNASPSPARDEVREAAEKLDSLVNRIWSMTPEESEAMGMPTVAKTLRAAKSLLSALAAKGGDRG